MAEVQFLVQINKKQTWERGSQLINKSTFRDKVFEFARKERRVHHSFLLNIIQVNGEDRVILAGNAKVQRSYTGMSKDKFMTHKVHTNLEEENVPLTLSKWDSSKKIVVHINGNAGSNDDEEREASDADIESWYGLIVGVDMNRKEQEVEVHWLSRVGKTNTFQRYDLETDKIPLGSIEKIWKNASVLENDQGSTVEANYIQTDLLDTQLSSQLLYMSENCSNLITRKQELSTLDSPKGKKPVRILELMCGKKSVDTSIAMKAKESIMNSFAGYECEVTTVDIDPKYKPDFVLDILDWRRWIDLKDKNGELVFEPGKYDLVVFTPPCTEYSMAKTFGYRRLGHADRLVKVGLAFILEHLRPRFWIMENPASGAFALHRRGFMSKFEKFRNETTYCHWGFPYRKLTSIWSNISDLELQSCLVNHCEYFEKYGHHKESAQQGTSS